ncbi:MAG: glycosyltransferase family 2 protein [Spirochaetaceae bacterium]|nr:glycosyltransferase family 2 protein [Spirochaetaceae bacterium]
MENVNEPYKISVVIPCFNEEAAIEAIYNATLKAALPAGCEIEFVFVDDGSKDGTLDELRKLAAKDGRVHYISFSRNFGKEAALLAGLRWSRGAYTVTLDADGQDPPSLIPQMLEAVSSGVYECAGTRRTTRKGEPAARSFFARLFYALMGKITEVDVVDGARDFRLMNKKYRDAVLSLPERNRFSKGVFPWVGFKIKWFEYENIERTAGATKWSFWKLFLYSIDGITAFSSKPLAVASFIGVLLFFISAAFIVFIAVRRLAYGDPVAGWASTACIVLFCSGFQLFTIGVLGQYLAKVYTEVKQRPHYIIKETR